jgi:Cof subfamily protein (haloacid dehalogenase superfamily)
LSFKLLALDLDDTLLNEDFRISEENRYALRRTAKNGVLVTLATGRMFRSAVPFARELEIDLPLITYHGALIRTAGGEKTLYHQPVPLDLAKEVAAIGRDGGYHVNAYINDELFVEEENEFSEYYQRIAKVKVTAVGSLASFLETPPTKLTIINRDGKLDALKNDLIMRFSRELSINISRPHFLEITDKLATKGQALKFLADMHNIPREQVAAVGDSYNDIDMLIYAGTGVAVANARDEVKAVADVITSSNVDHGVAAFIKQYLFEDEGEYCD